MKVVVKSEYIIFKKLLFFKIYIYIYIYSYKTLLFNYFFHLIITKNLTNKRILMKKNKKVTPKVELEYRTRISYPYPCHVVST